VHGAHRPQSTLPSNVAAVRGAHPLQSTLSSNIAALRRLLRRRLQPSLSSNVAVRTHAAALSAADYDTSGDPDAVRPGDGAVAGRERVEVLGAEVEHVGRFVDEQVLDEVGQ